MCQYMLAIPAHNANIERIFSMLRTQWTDERNRMLIETIKFTLIVKYNLKNKDCIEFYKDVCKNDVLLKEVHKSAKYDF